MSAVSFSRRVAALARALENCPIVQGATPSELRRWAELELGPGALEGKPMAYGPQRLQLEPLSPVLHVVSGNTPHAAVQSLVRSILAGVPVNWLKLPNDSALPDLHCFIDALPKGLRPCLAQALPPEWLRDAAAVAVYGSDETLRVFARQVAPWQRWIAHGTKLSFGLIGNGYCDKELAAIARDVVAFNQLGCVSPQFYLVEPPAANFAEALAAVFARDAAGWPALGLTPTQAAEVRAFRDECQLQAALGENVMVWESSGGLDWTIVFDGRPRLRSTPLRRSVLVKTAEPATLLEVRRLHRFVSTVAVYPYTSERVQQAVALGAQRVCPAGAMQTPDWLWHHDGWPSLGAFMRYIDLEGEVDKGDSQNRQALSEGGFPNRGMNSAA